MRRSIVRRLMSRRGYQEIESGNAADVSKQAAQQPHTTPESVARQLLTRRSGRRRSGRELFERFTPGARAVLVHAHSASQRMRHNFIGTEHILLGLLDEHDGFAARALAELGVTGEAVEAAITADIGCGEEDVPGHIPFKPRSKKVLELSLREAMRLGHTSVGTEHILLGLLHEGRGLAGKVLARHGVDTERASEVITRLMGDTA